MWKHCQTCTQKQIFSFEYSGYRDLLTFKEYLFTFYKRDSASFKLLYCLDQISLISYIKTIIWMTNFRKQVKNIKITLAY